MDPSRTRELANHYRSALLDDVIPFWLRHSLDPDHGGYLTCLDRDGRPYSGDKGVWLQARQVWMLSKLYNEVEARDEWLDAAKLGYSFLVEHAFAPDGRMYFTLTREGAPLRRRRYLFSESFGVIACAEFARATGDEEALQRAVDTYGLMVRLSAIPGATLPKTEVTVRPTRSLALPMILLATTQELRAVAPSALCERVAARSVEDVLGLFLHEDECALHETVGTLGERLDSPEGRLINPGHSIETAWFLLREAQYRGDGDLQAMALRVLRWSLDLGWDDEHGGLLYFVDLEGRPPEALEWDMKLWWPHTEALYATLLAHQLTGEPGYAAWFERLHEYAFSHFADPERGEWIGYLHRGGSVALPVKGSLWKGCFHLPRALWLCWRALDEMCGAGTSG